jgi:hypothetical protein
MPLTATKRFVNNSNVSFTPAGGGSAVDARGVQSVGDDPGIELLNMAGDADFWDTTVVAVRGARTVTIELLEIGTFNTVTPGAIGTLVWTRNDARNAAAAGGGALVYTLSEAVYKGMPVNSAHRQAAKGTISFEAQSVDGATDPLTITSA